MYIPPAFQVQDPERLAAFVEQNSFATVITHADGAPFASHVPLLLDRVEGAPGRLLGHFARANPQWRHFANGQEILVIFHGPHAYISPNWYKTAPAVPTWNYAVVHAYGKPQLIEDEAALEKLVRRTIHFYEGDAPGAWRGELPAEYLAKMLKGIVGFEITVTRWEGKFKLGQNRSAEDIAGVHTALSQSANKSDQALADFMKSQGVV